MIHPSQTMTPHLADTKQHCHTTLIYDAEDSRHVGRRKKDEIKQKDSEQETKKHCLRHLLYNHLKWGKSPVVFKKDWWCRRIFCHVLLSLVKQRDCLYPPFEVWPLLVYLEIWKITSCRIQAVASKIFFIWVLRGVASWNRQPHNLFCSLINQERKQFERSRGKQITILRYWGGGELTGIKYAWIREGKQRDHHRGKMAHFKMRGTNKWQLEGGENKVFLY